MNALTNDCAGHFTLTVNVCVMEWVSSERDVRLSRSFLQKNVFLFFGRLLRRCYDGDSAVWGGSLDRFGR